MPATEAIETVYEIRIPNKPVDFTVNINKFYDWLESSNSGNELLQKVCSGSLTIMDLRYYMYEILPREEPAAKFNPQILLSLTKHFHSQSSRVAGRQ